MPSLAAGVYHFAPGALVLVAKTSCIVTKTNNEGAVDIVTYCVAPIVAHADQTRVLFWASGGENINCQTADLASTCWADYASGTPLVGYACALQASLVHDELQDMRRDANRKLAFNSTVESEATLNALPAVFIVLDATPEATVNASFRHAALSVGAVVGVTIVLFLLVFCCSGCTFDCWYKSWSRRSVAEQSYD